MNEERVFSLKSSQILKDKDIKEDPDGKEIGPLPQGTFISSYSMDSVGHYLMPYREKSYYNESYYSNETYYDRWGFLRYRLKTRMVPYWYTGYKDVPYKYSCKLSIYDTSDQFSFFENSDSTCKRIMNDFETMLSDYNHWRFMPIDYKSDAWRYFYGDLYKNRLEAVTYKTKSIDDIDVTRSIYFANKRVYILEIKSKYEGVKIANQILENLTTIDLYKYNSAFLIKSVGGLIVLILSFLIFIQCCTYNTIKLPIRNKTAYGFRKYVLYLTIVDVLLLLVLIVLGILNNNFRSEYFLFKWFDIETIVYTGIVSLLLMNMVFYPYLDIKSKRNYCYDFLIPLKLSEYYAKRLDSEQERKTMVSMLYYPLFVIGPMPLGVICLLYVVPFFVIIFITVELRKIYRWINKDVMLEKTDQNAFIDYYVVLDLKKDADRNEIEKAFNTAMARYNSIDGNPLFGKQYYNEVQEAYAILSSSNQLRPEYDIEYAKYKSRNCASYSYSNKQLENEILNIRNKLYKVKSKGRSFNMNIIVVSFVLLIVMCFVVLRLTEIVPPLWGGSSYSGGSRWSGGDFC